MLARSAFALSRRAAFSPVARRAFTSAVVRQDAHGHDAPAKPPASNKRNMDKKLEDITSAEDLLPEGASPGTIPSDYEQATGLERLEIIGKMQGIDIFDMRPLPSDRLGTLEDPIVVRSAGEEQYCGCKGLHGEGHGVKWLRISRDRPLGRCTECGSCYYMEYVGPDHVHHAERTTPEPKSFADYIKPEYYYR